MPSYFFLCDQLFWNWYSLSRFVRSKRSSIAPNFNFLGQLLELNSQLFPSNSPGQSVTGSGESTPTQQQQPQTKQSETHQFPGLTSLASKPPTGLPSPALSASPKHVGTKKRERPTYVSLKVPAGAGGEFLSTVAGPQTSQSVPEGSHMVGSPTEGKRSRVSLINPPSSHTSSDQFLPSPSTEISHLHLSSPCDPNRGFAQPSLESLHYEPCSVGGSSETTLSALSSTDGRWRRSLTSLGMASASPGPIRPTLLAERRVSSQQSAPSTPNYFAAEQGWRRGGLQPNLPSPGSAAPSQTSSVPFTRDYSPIAERSTEPSVEHSELQKCAFHSSSRNELEQDMSFDSTHLLELPENHDHLFASSPVLCNLRLSQSAPSCSRSFFWPFKQNSPQPVNHSDACALESSFLVVLQSSIPWNQPWSRLTRLRTHALGLELSCRQEQTFNQRMPADPSLPYTLTSRSSLSASTGNLYSRTLAALWSCLVSYCLFPGISLTFRLFAH